MGLLLKSNVDYMFMSLSVMNKEIKSIIGIKG